jgi:hypothetical protein
VLGISENGSKGWMLSAGGDLLCEADHIADGQPGDYNLV